MSVRRRAIRARVERERQRARGRAAVDASLARMQRVLDDAKAAGETQLSRQEFWRRYNELKAIPCTHPATRRVGIPMSNKTHCAVCGEDER